MDPFLQDHWLIRDMTKICVRVDSEAELLEIAQRAEVAG
jgi:peptidyl-tRNA hydrolase